MLSKIITTNNQKALESAKAETKHTSSTYIILTRPVQY